VPVNKHRNASPVPPGAVCGDGNPGAHWVSDALGGGRKPLRGKVDGISGIAETLKVASSIRQYPANRSYCKTFHALNTVTRMRRFLGKPHLPQVGNSRYPVGADRKSTWRQGHQAAMGLSNRSGGWMRWISWS
jgi:hypothetical protein